MAVDQLVVRGLVDVDRRERIGHFDRADVEPELAADRRERLVERPQPQHRAEQHRTGPAPSSMRQPFLRSCSTARHSSIAGATSGRPSRNRLAPL